MPQPFVDLPEIAKLAEVVQDAIELSAKAFDNAEAETGLQRWKALRDKWPTAWTDGPINRNDNAQQADGAVECAQLVQVLRDVEVASVFGRFIEETLGKEASAPVSDIFLSNAEELELLFPFSVQPRIAKSRCMRDVESFARRLAAGPAPGIIQVAGVVQQVYNSFPDVKKANADELSAGFLQHVDSVEKLFGTMFADLTGKCQVEKAIALSKKYHKVLDAADKWDFTGVPFIHKSEDQEVRADAKQMDGFLVTLPPNMRILASAEKKLTFDFEKQTLAQKLQKDHAAGQKDLATLPHVLATMMLCEILVKPVQKDRQQALKTILKYIEQRLVLPQKQLAVTLQKKVTEYMGKPAAPVPPRDDVLPTEAAKGNADSAAAAIPGKSKTPKRKCRDV